MAQEHAAIRVDAAPNGRHHGDVLSLIGQLLQKERTNKQTNIKAIQNQRKNATHLQWRISEQPVSLSNHRITAFARCALGGRTREGLAAFRAEERVLSLRLTQRANQNGVVLTVIIDVDEVTSWALRFVLEPACEEGLELPLGSLAAESLDKVIDGDKLHGHGSSRKADFWS